MCGIAGNINGRDAAARVARTLAHRGPDDEGIARFTGGVCDITLIHRRLSILDLSPAGHQPMSRGRLRITFNGEIYNFRELRRELEQDGLDFHTSCDTEVILAAYERWGLDCICRLHGMFAFALWDENKNELILARDRLGKKPLFYHCKGRSFSFASEIKAILAMLDKTPAIDQLAVDEYLTYLYIPYPRTIFQGIYQLPPATWMRIRVGENGLVQESAEYWDPLQTPVDQKMSVRDEAVELRELVEGAVTSRLVSDVPLGVLLSGGLDSSMITAVMSRNGGHAVRSFSIGFAGNQTYDEIPFAQRVAKQFGCDHRVLQAEPSCSRHLAKIIWHLDQPFGNPTAILTYILSALTRRSVTVALGGDGGDEVFGGYPRYVGAYASRVPRSFPVWIRNRILPQLGAAMADDLEGHHQFRRLREFLESSGLPLIEMYLQWVGYFSEAEKEQLYSPAFSASVAEHDPGNFLRHLYARSEGLEEVNRLAYVDVKSFLCCNVLEYADRMSMAHSLELRAPLTDHRLVEFGLRIPFNRKFRYGHSKWIAKRAMRGLLPRDVLCRQKLGFNPPVNRWLMGELHGLVSALLSFDRVRERGLFRPEAIRQMLTLHYSGRRDFSLKIWALMMLEIWHRQYVDRWSVEETQDEIDSLSFSADGPLLASK
jgi:asparagine synthase (glutamine-hydrolysing)